MTLAAAENAEGPLRRRIGFGAPLMRRRVGDDVAPTLPSAMRRIAGEAARETRRGRKGELRGGGRVEAVTAVTPPSQPSLPATPTVTPTLSTLRHMPAGSPSANEAEVDLADIDESVPTPPDVLAAGDLLMQEGGDEDLL